jgi:DNA-binding CsgD family transcriptional regulator
MGEEQDATWRFINLAPVTGSQAALDELFAQTLRPFGVDRFDCGNMPSDTQLPSFVTDVGLADWKRYYFDQGYNKTDPVALTHHGFRGSYTWTEVKALSTDKQGQAIWSDARAGGMREGLIVPIAPRRPSQTTVRMTTAEERFAPEALPLLQSIAVVYAFATSSHCMTPQEIVQKPAAKPPTPVQSKEVLTERELECLYWAARGKSNPEIATIIKLSRHTVNTHIENAKRKFGVATRVQAVGIAHRLGLLSIA